MMCHSFDGMWGMHWISIVLWILFLIGIFAMIWKISANKKKEETPLDMLKKRFAKGEITKEEYEEQKQILNQ